MTAPIHCCYRGCMLTVWTPGDAGLEVNTSSATCLTCRRVALCLPHFATVTASRRGLRCAHCGAARWYVYLFEPARIDDGLRHAIEEAGGRVEARNTRRASVSGSGLRGWPGESRDAGPRAHTAADSQRGPTSTSLDDGPRSEGARDRSAPTDASRGSRSYGARRLPGDADGDGERRAVESAEQRHAPGGAPESATTADRRVAFTDRGPHRGHERPAPASQERSPDGPARRDSAPGAEMDATRPADREGRMGAAHGARAVNAADVQHDPAPPGAAKPRRSGPPPLPASRVAPTTAPETSAAARSALLLRATPASLARPRPERRAFDLGERVDEPGALPLSLAAERHPEAGRAERALPLSIAAERHPEAGRAERALPLSIAAERHPEAGRAERALPLSIAAERHPEAGPAERLTRGVAASESPAAVERAAPAPAGSRPTEPSDRRRPGPDALPAAASSAALLPGARDGHRDHPSAGSAAGAAADAPSSPAGVARSSGVPYPGQRGTSAPPSRTSAPAVRSAPATAGSSAAESTPATAAAAQPTLTRAGAPAPQPTPAPTNAHVAQLSAFTTALTAQPAPAPTGAPAAPTPALAGASSERTAPASTGAHLGPGSAPPDAAAAAYRGRGSALPPDPSAGPSGASPSLARAETDARVADPILRPWSWLPARAVPPDATPAAPGVLLRRLGAAVRPIVDGVALDLTLPVIEAVSRAPGATGDLVIAGRMADGARRLTWMSAGGQRLDLPPPPGGRLSAPAFVDDHRFVYVAVVDDHAELREATIEGDSRLRTRRITALGAAPDGPHPPPAVFQHREAVVAFAASDGGLRPVRIRLADGHATPLDVAQPAPRRLVAAPRGSLAAWITAEGEVRCAGPGLSPRVLGQADDDLLAIADDGAAVAWVTHGHLAVARPRSGDVQTRPLPEAIAALSWSPRNSRTLPKFG